MNNLYIKHSDDENSLTHYGVKGMKWRKHKARGNDDIRNKYLEIERDKDGNAISGTWKTANGPAAARAHGAAETIRGKAMQERARRLNEAKWKGLALRQEIQANHSTSAKINRALKKPFKASKKAVSKGASFLSKKFGGYRIKAGKMNTVSANGKKHKRYVSITKNVRPKAFIPY